MNSEGTESGEEAIDRWELMLIIFPMYFSLWVEVRVIYRLHARGTGRRPEVPISSGSTRPVIELSRLWIKHRLGWLLTRAEMNYQLHDLHLTLSFSQLLYRRHADIPLGVEFINSWLSPSIRVASLEFELTSLSHQEKGQK